MATPRNVLPAVTGLGLIVFSLAFILWGDDWVEQAIEAYDRRTDAYPALQAQQETSEDE